VRGLCVLALCSCYNPSGVAPCTVSCDLATQSDCPGGLECRADGLCHAPGVPTCGSSDGGPDAKSFAANVVFVTSVTKAPQDLGGLAGADQLCHERAVAGGLPGMYVAWLSVANTHARDRIPGNARGWVRPDGLPVADTRDDLLTNGKLLYPPRVDELGIDHPEPLAVVTASNVFGGLFGDTCTDFTGTGTGPHIGRADGTTTTWTQSGEVTSCDNGATHLYCFGIDRTDQILVAPSSHAVAFLSDGVLTYTGAGVGTADMLCDDEAGAHGLGTGFKGLLATTIASASSRVGMGPWRRVDSVEVGTLDHLLAPINVTPTMQYVSDVAWTGAGDPNQLGAASSTCGDWMAPAQNGMVGDVSRSNGQLMFFVGTTTCTQLRRIYCLHP
jgi:hypothetical protein